MMKKTIIFAGGGSGGHVLPALTIIDELNKRGGYNVLYIGSETGIERDLVSAKGLPYRSISTGKLRRYLSIENVRDMFRVFKGVIDAWKIIGAESRDALIFSTGGFVSVPVVIAAWLRGRKVFVHEQTSRVGLANRIAGMFAEKVLISFEASKLYFDESKVMLTGYPLRAECFTPAPSTLNIAGRTLDTANAPILFATGGGNGARLINELIKKNLDWLTRDYLVVHQVGKSFIEEYKALASDRYLPVPFVADGMIDLMKVASVVISRAGAGTVCELMAIGKPSLFIPLKMAQKNEQFHNAMEASRVVGSLVIEEKDVDGLDLQASLKKLLLVSKKGPNQDNGLLKIVTLIEQQS
jgi:UDP-N-acetylglucosamine--N-acetylmuramyl-(pentapeptide) pyrophosphoryl-undecaprenol N-acetylglucosamine transferase